MTEISYFWFDVDIWHVTSQKALNWIKSFQKSSPYSESKPHFLLLRLFGLFVVVVVFCGPGIRRNCLLGFCRSLFLLSSSSPLFLPNFPLLYVLIHCFLFWFFMFSDLKYVSILVHWDGKIGGWFVFYINNDWTCGTIILQVM